MVNPAAQPTSESSGSLAWDSASSGCTCGIPDSSDLSWRQFIGSPFVDDVDFIHFRLVNVFAKQQIDGRCHAPEKPVNKSNANGSGHTIPKTDQLSPELQTFSFGDPSRQSTSRQVPPGSSRRRLAESRFPSNQPGHHVRSSQSGSLKLHLSPSWLTNTQD